MKNKIPCWSGFFGKLAGLSVVAGGLLLAGGCGILSSPSYRPVEIFDLGAPEDIPGASFGELVSISQISAQGALFQSRMAYRTDVCSVFIDEYNRWVQPPPAMLTRFIERSMAGASSRGAPRYMLECQLTEFEIDLRGRQVVLGVGYTISRGSDRHVLHRGFSRHTAIFADSGPKYFAAAMTGAANLFVRKMVDVVASIETEAEGGGGAGGAR